MKFFGVTDNYVGYTRREPMDTRLFVDHLNNLAGAMRKKIEELRPPLEQVEKDLEHVLGMIDFYARNAPKQPASPIPPFPSVTVRSGNPPLSLRGLSQKQAVIAIAKANGGVVKAQDAKRLMIEAGIMKNTKNSTRMVHNAIINSERFDRIAPGEFRLKVVVAAIRVSNAIPSGAASSAMATGVFPPKPPVQ